MCTSAKKIHFLICSQLAWSCDVISFHELSRVRTWAAIGEMDRMAFTFKERFFQVSASKNLAGWDRDLVEEAPSYLLLLHFSSLKMGREEEEEKRHR